MWLEIRISYIIFPQLFILSQKSNRFYEVQTSYLRYANSVDCILQDGGKLNLYKMSSQSSVLLSNYKLGRCSNWLFTYPSLVLEINNYCAIDQIINILHRGWQTMSNIYLNDNEFRGEDECCSLKVFITNL